MEPDEKARYGEDDRANHVVGFIERCQARFENENAMEPASAGRLLAALRRVGREFNLEFEYKKPARLGRRISDDPDVIRDTGSTSTGSAMPTPRISSIGSARTGEYEGEPESYACKRRRCSNVCISRRPSAIAMT